MRITDFAFFAPCARQAFIELSASLAHDTPFLLFEGYRSPTEQDLAYRRNASKAQAMESAHQYGLAGDFVPFIDGNWRWDQPDELWTTLTVRASEFGLLTSISWDRPHVEHPAWKRVRLATR